MITYLSSRVDKPEEVCDICIVGGGAAGCELAYSLRDSGLSVVLLESGFLDFDWETQRLCRFEQVGHKISTADHSKPFGCDEAKLHEFRYRALGGTLNIWGKRWMKLNPVDFVQRPEVEYTGWPITFDDIYPYYKAISEEYQLTELEDVVKIITSLQMKTADSADLRLNPFVKQRNPSPIVFNYVGFLDCRNNVKVILGANVCDIRLSTSGTQVESMLARTLKGQECRIRAKQYVLACGSVENARLLLCSNSQIKEGIGNQTGWVGRNLIDHFKGFVGKLTLNSPEEDFPEGYLYAAAGKALGFHLSLNPEILLKKGLPDHALRFMEDAESKAKNQLMFTVEAFCEQWPNRESCITLTSDKDELGMPIACLNWKFIERDREDLRRYLEFIVGSFEKHKIGHLTLNEDFDNLDNKRDSSHQMGTTRMAKDASLGVVDADCKVFGLGNLFIMGSSVFPTGGNANPTFTILALARRLGAHLASV